MMSEESNVERFAKAAARYVGAIENLDTISREALVVELAEVLPELYAAAWQLPETQIVSDSPVSDAHRTDKKGKLFDALRKKLGDWDVYRCVFDPTNDEEAITCNLANDLADIYWEVREYSEGSAAGMALADVLWEMKLGFRTHWGRHATSALAVIHELRLRVA
jgi:uncharacterized protein DUF5063